MRGIEPISDSLTFLDFAERGAVPMQLLHFAVDGRHRSRHVHRVDAGANQQRPFPDCSVERAERVIGHALLLADVFSESPAQPELPKDVVHHPVRVVTRVETPDRREPVGDVSL